MDTAFISGASLIFKAIGWVFLPVLLLPMCCLLLKRVSFFSDLQYCLIEIIDTLSIKIGEATKWLLVVMVVSIAFGVIALSIFGQSWTKLDESAVYFHALVILLGSSATLLAGQHVRVDIFYSQMNERAKALVDIIGYYALLIPFCLIIIWHVQGTIALSWLSFEGSAESDGIRGIYLLKTGVSIFAITLLMQGMAIAGRAVLLLTKKTQPPLPLFIDALFSDDSKQKNMEASE